MGADHIGCSVKRRLNGKVAGNPKRTSTADSLVIHPHQAELAIAAA